MERSIEASTKIRVPYGPVFRILLDDPGAVFTETHTVKERRERHLRIELGVNLGAGASVHQEVTLQLGVPRLAKDGVVLPVAWRATGRERWLPTFHGELEASAAGADTRLRLNGAYTVPLGLVGKFGDGVLGRRLASRSLRTLVERLACRLESQAQPRPSSEGWHRAPDPAELREEAHSEIYVG